MSIHKTHRCDFFGLEYLGYIRLISVIFFFTVWVKKTERVREETAN
jgi:hypothetical protein